MTANLLTESVARSNMRPQEFPDPLRYYRSAKIALAPDVRNANSPDTLHDAIAVVAQSTVVPVIPWLYVQLQALGEWEVPRAYVAHIIAIGGNAMSRWQDERDAVGLPRLWERAASVLPCVKAARQAVSDYLESCDINNLSALPEPDDDWSLREKTWFSRNISAAIAAELAIKAGMRPEKFHCNATPFEVAERVAARTTPTVIHRRKPAPEARPARLGKVWTPAVTR